MPQKQHLIIFLSVFRFIKKNADYLQADELAQTNAAIDQLKVALDTDQKDRIQKLLEELNEISKPYAERIMDKAIGMAMRGKKV